MNRIIKIATGSKSYLTLSSIVIAVVVLIVGQVYSNKKQSQLGEIALWVIQTQEVIESILEIQSLVYEIETTNRGFAILKDEELEKKFAEASFKLSSVLSGLVEKVKDNSVQYDRVYELAVLAEQKVEFSDSILRLTASGKTDDALGLIRSGQGARISERIKDLCQGIVTAERALLAERRASAESAYRQTITNGWFIAAGAIIVIFISFFIVYQQMRIQRRYRRQEKSYNKLLHQFLDSMPGGVIVIDMEFNPLIVNDTAKDLLGLKRDDYNSLTDIISETHLFQTEGEPVSFDEIPIVKALQGQKTDYAEWVIENDTGKKVLESRATPVYDEEGRIVYAVASVRDITHRKNQEIRLREAIMISEEAVRTRDVFLSNISHELRTPLNAILGFTSLLRQNESDPKKHQQLTSIAHSGENLLSLINDLLDLSKIESGQMAIEEIPVQLGALIDSIAIPMKQRALDKNIDFKVHIKEDLPVFILSDPLRLTQILNNLCSNAIKFTENGMVELYVGANEIIGNKSTLSLVVKDSGIGIPDIKLKSIFDRFTQASDDITRKFGGTGLGLNIVKQLVDLLGGEIDVTSKVDEGSVFSVRIPVTILSGDDIQQKTVTEEVNDPSIDLSGIKVLIAEDNELNQRLVQAYLEKYGIQPDIASNGAEAIEKQMYKEYDIIFMDIQMPVLNGYLATEKIRKLGYSTSIVAMTAHAMDGEREKCLRSGMNDYLTKPIREHSLIKMLKKQVFNTSDQSSSTQEEMTSGSQQSDNRLNESLIQELFQTPEIMEELVSMFEEDYPEYLSRIQLSVRSSDKEESANLIHKFRSSVSSIGLQAIERKLSEMEHEVQTTGQISKDNYLWFINLPDVIQEDLKCLKDKATQTI